MSTHRKRMTKGEAFIVTELLAGGILQVYGKDQTGSPVVYEILRQGKIKPADKKAVENLWGTLAVERAVYRHTRRKLYYHLHPTLRGALVNMPSGAVTALIDMAKGWTLVARHIAPRPGRKFSLVRGRETKPVPVQAPHSLIARDLVFIEMVRGDETVYKLTHHGLNAAAFIAAK